MGIGLAAGATAIGTVGAGAAAAGTAAVGTAAAAAGGLSALSVGSLAAGAIGAGVSAIGAISSAQAQSADANYQAQVAKNNAITASQNANYATQAGNAKAESASLQAKQRLGAVTAALAASGVDVNSGSAKQDQITQRETGELGTENVANESALQAYGYRTQQTSFSAQSALDTAEASQATTAGGYNAAGGLLAGASGVGLNYVKLNQMGAFGPSATPASQIYPAGGLT